MTNITPIRLQTIFGADQFRILQSQLASYKNEHNEEDFRKRCLEDADRLTEYLNFFLEDEEMMKQYPMNEDDKIGWQLFNELSDIIGSLNYFGRRQQ
jgi:DNA-binding MurR/RpiR family transcriptional regulator